MESGVYTLKIIRVIRAKKQPDKLAVNPYNIPNMMKTLIHTLLPAALLLLTATACEDTLTTPAATIGHGDGPTLTLVLDNNEEKAGTRSTLNDGAPVNHVETVRILVFQGTGDNATYVGEEVYADNATAINWPTTEDGKEKLDKITYQMNYAFVEGETYTLLGVGMDSHTDETITEPEEWNDVYDISLKKDETKLSEAYATLKAGKTKEHIARHDFYTGTTTFTHEGKNTHIDDLLMKRRVAGVMLYVTEIPQSLTDENNDNYRVTSIKLELGANQKSSVRLQRDFDDLKWTEFEGQAELENSKVVAEITGLETANYNQGKDFYEDKNGTPLTQYAGAYMLPLNKSEDADYKTFTVTLCGKKFAGGGEVTGNIDETATEVSLKSFTIENRSEEDSPAAFDIRSNYLYSIGKYNPEEGVDEPISLSGRPIYLEVLPFQEMEVNHDFESARIQAVFAPDFNEEKYRFNCINNTFTVKVLPSLFKDKWTITIPDETTAYDVKGESKTYNTRDDNTEMTHWLWIKTGENTVSKSYTCTDDEKENGATITFVMLDYAVYRPWGWVNHEWNPTTEDIQHINDDVRTVKVELKTIRYDNNGEEITPSRCDYLNITQYNTITVDFTHKQNSPDEKLNSEDFGPAICGFSRVDWGDKLYPYPTDNYVVYNDPDVVDEKGPEGMFTNYAAAIYKSSGWGYFNTSAATISYDENTRRGSQTNGAKNIKHLGKDKYDAPWNGIWGGCAAQKCEQLFLRVNGTTLTKAEYDGNSTTDLCWYLPAVFELEGLMTAAFDREIEDSPLNANLNRGTPYWSSTITNAIDEKDGYAGYCVQALKRTAYPFTDATVSYRNRGSGYFNSKLDEQEKHNSSGTLMYLRPARQFTQYYQEGEAQNDAWTTLPDGQADAEAAAQL